MKILELPPHNQVKDLDEKRKPQPLGIIAKLEKQTCLFWWGRIDTYFHLKLTE